METENCGVERILSRNNGSYLVKWAGYPMRSSTWEPKNHLDNCEDKIKEFEEQENSLFQLEPFNHIPFKPRRIIGQKIKKDEKKRRREIFYEVEWEGMPNKYTTFEPRNSVLDYKKIIKSYEGERERLEDIEDDEDYVIFDLSDDEYDDIGSILPESKM